MIELTNKYGEPLSDKEIERQIAEERKARKMLIIRNWLNGIFIILSLISIVGVLYFKSGDPWLYYSYAVAVIAVIIKMIEAIFRMPGFARGGLF